MRLISTPVGPWEQGVATVLHAKACAFELVYLNPGEKPDWFLALSPHGKTPALDLEGTVLFETRAIAEYLEEALLPRLHPEDLVERARHRAWLDFLPVFQRASSDVNNAKSRGDIDTALDALPHVLGPMTDAFTREEGPLFGGGMFSLTDALYAPFLHRLLWSAPILKTEIRRNPFEGFPEMEAWAETLLDHGAVRAAIRPDFDARYREHLSRRGTWLSGVIPTE